MQVSMLFNSRMIECQICLREFSGGDVGRTPRILTDCGHTLCEDCVKKILKEDKITCPFDRTVTALGETGVESLHKNYSVLESLREDKQMTNETTKTGIPCAENSSHDAVLYCLQCEIALCELLGKAEKAIINTFDKGKKKALEDLRSFSEWKISSMKEVNDDVKKNLLVLEELREEIYKKARMNIIIDSVDEESKFEKVKENIADNINNRDALHRFDDYKIFLPVTNIQFAKKWSEVGEFRNSGVVCIYDPANSTKAGYM
ncbi:hypothetical protein CAEBREN_22669 [Caenorhabditis brenneri]|uniref:RING-type domain-containing protein n=1 Tax=Caenorhabditis brenneri TaxID=135651 RepID=G0PFV1_CAEBE|nr:hypothetical protein CAEBREN_22669 [Caenorhabditis brenneri]